MSEPSRKGTLSGQISRIVAALSPRRRKFRKVVRTIRKYSTRTGSAQNPDLAQWDSDPLWHYVMRGAAEGRSPAPLFDSKWYLAQNPVLAQAGNNRLVTMFCMGLKKVAILRRGFTPNGIWNNTQMWQPLE